MSADQRSVCGWIGHKFRPRFNRIPVTGAKFSSSSEVFSSDLVKMMTRTEYVLDICERCGRVVKDDVLITSSDAATVTFA